MVSQVLSMQCQCLQEPSYPLEQPCPPLGLCPGCVVGLA